MGRKLSQQRKKIWMETKSGLVPSKEAAENLMEIFKPSPIEIAIHENAFKRRIKEKLLSKGKDGNYYLTQKAISLLQSANENF